MRICGYRRVEIAAQIASPRMVHALERTAVAVATGAGTPSNVVRNVKTRPSRTTRPCGTTMVRKPASQANVKRPATAGAWVQGSAGYNEAVRANDINPYN